MNNILKKNCGLPVAKGEDLIDTTQNMDVFVEVHGIVKSGAVSMIKMANDLRFLSSGPKGGIGEIKLRPNQAGSSIMPGKINPVILENAIQISELVKAHDVLISNLAAAGHLELNAFMPSIGHSFLKSLSMLRDVNYNVASKCITGIMADADKCRENLLNSSAIGASLISTFGYDTIQDIAKYAEENDISFVQSLIKSKLVDESELFNILSQELE